MPTPEQLRDRLIAKLQELFQLNQPELDFGFYRLMHAKAAEVNDFLTHTLPQTIDAAFGTVSDSQKAELQAAVDKAIATAKEFGAPNPEETEPVKKARAALKAASGGVEEQSAIYDHLYRFFERYYDRGDFVSTRYMTRETANKAQQYAIPYSGEEVKLHWANADQYYIKTSENFNDFSFDLVQAPDFQKMDEMAKVMNQIPDHPVRVHFKLVDAAEGEHNNVKAADDKKRAFFLAVEDTPVSVADGVLEVHFEYRVEADADKIAAEQETELKNRFGVKNKGDMRLLQIAAAILDAVGALIAQGKAVQQDVALLEELASLLNWPSPTENVPQRPLIAKYLNKYTAKNTSDYFIHKDLGAFLRRELDFYIKNEIMQLDNIEDADAPRVESYLAKIKVFRNISHQVIDFLAQLENFQKKLWLKKKFVVQCDYCITLDRVPAEFYPEIFANGAQKAEWLNLGFPEGLLVPPTKAKKDGELFAEEAWSPFAYLMVDTKFFPEEFKQRLLAEIPNLDEQTDGLLVHSENFQALRLLQERYREQVKCIYIDPPYNTGSDDFIYKDGYKHSSWVSMLCDRIWAHSVLATTNGNLAISLDYNEQSKAELILKQIYGEDNYRFTVAVSRVKKNIKEHDFVRSLNWEHSYVIFASMSKDSIYDVPIKKSKVERTDDIWHAFDVPGVRPTMEFELFGHKPPKGRHWMYSYENAMQMLKNGDLREVQTGCGVQYKVPNIGGVLVGTNWLDIIEGDSTGGILTSKNTKLIERVIKCTPDNYREIVLDYFAGSGTTGHAVINLNREDGGKRKYILVEMGEHFNTVLKPRLEKVVFSKEWKDGKPKSDGEDAVGTSYGGVSHCFKYLRLESYEDTLNNIDFQSNGAFEGITDYRLKYMLDVESRGSQSLLNLEAFANPFAYQLNVRKAGSDESENAAVDLLETFNYLIGLRVSSLQAVQSYNAEFERLPDPELPEDQHTRLTIKGRLHHSADGKWRFRCVRGVVPKNRQTPNDGATERVLVIWRNLTGNLEEDNAVLDEYFQREGLSTQDNEVDVIYVNGSNNLPNLRQPQDTWKVRLTEEDFLARMWEEDDHA